jgi:hypothetical protein
VTTNNKNQTTADIERLIVRIVNLSLDIDAVENLLREKGKMPYDFEAILVTDSDGKQKTMRQFYDERSQAQLELQDKFLDHKTIPYVGADGADFILKIAASVLQDSDILEDRLQNDFDTRIEDMVKRYKDLSLFFVNEKPRQLVINRLREASDCYVSGFFQGCALLCRATLETALRQKLEEKGVNPNTRKTLGLLVEDATRFGIISKKDAELANRIKSVGDESAHDLKRVCSSEALESLTKTKLLLSSLFQETHFNRLKH